MSRFLILGAIAILASLDPTGAWAQGPDTITGRATAIDGDTVEIGGQRIDLFGIDAPEAHQICKAGGKDWRCGTSATFALAEMLGRQWVTCRVRKREAGGRIVAVCTLAGPTGPDVAAGMARNGWAVADRGATMDYAPFEDEARAAKRGLWAGSFMAPSRWRREMEGR